MNVVIVDDHPLVRTGLATLLTNETSMKVVGEASNHHEAIAVCSSLQPQMVIVDLQLGSENGLELIEEAQRLGLTSKFVLLTSSSSIAEFTRAKTLGVSGYLSKEALPEELLHALQLIAKGRTYYDPGILDNFISSRTASTANSLEFLTPKEKEVLIELGKGLSNKEISQMLYVTEYTVKKHVSQVLAKLNLADRTQAALYANATGLVRYVVN